MNSATPLLYVYNRPRRRWTRLHTATMLSVVLNVVVILGVAAFAGGMTDQVIYEVNLTDVMAKDAELQPTKKQKTRLTLDPAQVSHSATKRGRAGGRPAPAPAPGHRNDPNAKAPPPLKIDAPQVDPDSGPPEDIPTIVNRPPAAPDASLQGNPEGVTGGKGAQNSEGPGGRGTGGTGTGGTGPGGNGGGPGNGPGGGLVDLVNRVDCLGCHLSYSPVGQLDKGAAPYEIEKLFNSVRWKYEGTAHDLTLRCSINVQGYVTAIEVVQSSGRSDVDESAMNLIRNSHWKAGTSGGQPVETIIEMPLRIYY